MNLIGNGWDILLRFSSAAAMAAAGSGRSYGILLLLMGVNLILAFITEKRRRQAAENMSRWLYLLGPLRKATILAILLLSRLMDQAAGENHYLENGAMGFYLCHEGISLLQNAALLGVPVPPALRRALQALESENPENTDVESYGSEKQENA